MFSKYIVVILLSTVFFQSMSSATEERSAEEKKAEATWKPSATEYDWVQLTSGEWLKGEIKSMYNESLEFDSANLDLLSIDLEDIKFLQSFKKSSVNIEDVGSVFGKLNISEDIVSVGDGLDVKTYERVNLVSFVSGGAKESDLWTAKFSLGLDVKEGNTNQLDFTVKGSAKRRSAESRVSIDYISNISETGAVNSDRVKSINNHRINGKIDIYVTRYFFYTPLFAEYFSDEFQNIDNKSTVGVGIGYTLMDTDRTNWSVSGGPSHVSTKYLSVQEGEDLVVGSGSIALGTLYETDITKAISFIFKYDAQLSKEENGGYTHFLVSTFETEITGDLDFDVSFYWDRTNNPTVDEDNLEPAKNDYRLMIGVTYTY